jgi:uncharacterized membrane protein YphA (DoxX/SURF4 family)
VGSGPDDPGTCPVELGDPPHRDKEHLVNIALWIVTSLLAALFAASGMSKLMQPRAKLVAGGYGWAEDFTSAHVKLIGAVEVVGAVGLILPAALGVNEILTPMAAIGLTLVMIAAAAVHVRRQEGKHASVPVLLAVVAAAIGVLRFGPYAF